MPARKHSRLFPLGCGATVFLIGLLDVFGWAFGINALQSIFEDFMEMKLNTAILFLMMSTILILIALPQSKRSIIIQRFVAALVMSLAVLTLVEYILHINLGIDDPLQIDDPGDHTGPAGRPSIGTATGFLLLSVASFMLSTDKHYNNQFGEALSGLVLAIGLMAAFGYIYNVSSLYSIPFFATMALHTSLCFILLPLGFLSAKDHEGFLTILFKPSPGGYVARAGLGWLVLITMVTGFLCIIATKTGLFDQYFGIIAIAALSIFFAKPVIIWTAWSLDKLEAERQKTALSLHRQEEVNAWYSDFIALVSHEFRTPLANIDSSLQMLLLKMDDLNADMIKKYVGQIKQEIRKLSLLIANFFSVTKHEHGSIKLEKQPISLPKFLEDLVNHYRELYPQCAFTLLSNADPEDYVFDGDKALLSVAISNIISNAIKYANPSSAQNDITISCQFTDRFVIEISDNGIGISKDEIPKLFSKFYRGKDVSEVSGAGLGLYLAQKIIKLHEGEIGARSAGGTGSTFYVELPGPAG